MPFNVSCITLEYEYEFWINLSLLFLFLSGKEEQISKMYRGMVFKTKWEHQWLGEARQTANQELDSQYNFQKRIIKLYKHEVHMVTTVLKYHFWGIFETYIRKVSPNLLGCDACHISDCDTCHLPNSLFQTKIVLFNGIFLLFLLEKDLLLIQVGSID